MSLTLKYVKNGNFQALKDILELTDSHINYLDEKGKTPLIWAAQLDFVEIAELLLNYGADPDIFDMGGYRALTYAGRNSNYSIIDLLLAKGSNINLLNKKNESILFQLADATFEKTGKIKPKPQVLSRMINAGADLSLSTKLGTSPLMESCRYGATDAARVFLEEGANPNQKNKDGRTALMIAISFHVFDKNERKKSILELLLERHIDYDIDLLVTDKKGTSCMDLVHMFELEKIYTINLLTKTPAKKNRISL